MPKIVPEDGIKELHGKKSSNSEFAFVTNSSSGQVSTRMIGKRNKDKHPVTNQEVRVHTKMQTLVAEYQRIKSDPEAYAQLVQERNNAPRELQSDNTYHYFLKTRMDEGKNSVTLKIAKSKSSEETYVKGMQRCQTIDEADRLLVDFVEKLGYKNLAEAYKEIRKRQ